MEVAVQTPQAFPCAPPRVVACAMPNLSTTLHLVDMTTCAVLSLVIVQRRAPCLCNASRMCLCNASPTLMSVQCRSLRHGFHTLAHPTRFSHLLCQQPCAKRCKTWIRDLTCVESGVFAHAISMQNVLFLVAIGFLKQHSSKEAKIPQPLLLGKAETKN